MKHGIISVTSDVIALTASLYLLNATLYPFLEKLCGTRYQSLCSAVV